MAAASRQRRIYLNLEAVAADLFGIGGGKAKGGAGNQPVDDPYKQSY